MSNSISSLRSRLILLILTAMVPAFALILESAAKYRELTATQIKQNVLIAARAIASEQDRILENAHEFLVTISRVPQIRERERAACHKILAGLLEPRYADLVVADPNGTPICTALSTGNSLASSRGPHHNRTVESSDFAVGDIRRHPRNANFILDVSYPVLNHPGSVRAVVSAVLDLSWINRMAVETHLSPGATFTLVGSRGEVLLRHPEGSNAQTALFSDLSQALKLSSDREETIEATGSDGVHRLFAFSRLKNAVGGQAVYAAVDLPTDVAFAKIGEILVQQLIALGILAVVILASTWFGTDLLVLRRIRDIITATGKMAQGNLRARTTLAYDASELGQMARAFDNLAETLERREAEALQSAEKIQRQRRQQEALYDLNRGITSTLDGASVLGTLLDHTSALFSSCAIAVSWINKQADHLETIAHRGTGNTQTADSELASIQCLAMAILKERTARALSSDRGERSAADQEILAHHQWASYLGLPLTVKNEVWGVLSFYSKEKAEFTADEISFLSALVNEAATAIHNSQLFEQTREQAAELEKSNRIKDEFLGVMSHELRTPLNIIMNYAEALRMGTFGDIGPDQVRGTDKIRAQAGHLLALINGILEITKIESGTISVETRPVDLNDFMAELKSDYMLPRENNVALVWNDSAELPIIITDRIKLKQIVTNLINNAIKFTDKGSVTIDAKTSPDGNTLEINIADTGPGIANELLPFVFDKFRQIDSATTRNYSGAGLGLYIVKNFVNLLGGTIDVRSKLGEGSQFTVRLAIAAGIEKRDDKSPQLTSVGTDILS